jgi:hypothetical protein
MTTQLLTQALYIAENCNMNDPGEGYPSLEPQRRALITALKAHLEAQPEPVAYLYHDANTPKDAHPWLHSTMLVLAADRRPNLRGETPLYTAAPKQPAPQPSGYAYRYPDGIRFNNGREVNGSKPTESIPYWFGQQPAPQPLTDIQCEDVLDEAQHLYRRHRNGVRGQQIAPGDSPSYWVIRATEAMHGITAPKGTT